MKNLLLFIFCSTLFFTVKAQSTNPNYDAELAKTLGADDYGMKQYILVMLKTGTNTSSTKAEYDDAFAGHMTNMGRLVKENKLVVAGPMGKTIKTIEESLS